MKAKYYKEDDLLVLRFSDKPFEVAEKVGSFIIHYDTKREAVLVEILNASKLLKATSKALSKPVWETIFSAAP